MKIGIIGAGKIGVTAARLFIQAGHEIALTNSRGPNTLQELVRELGPRARAVPVEKAIRFGDLVLLAIPFGSCRSLPAKAFRGKIVVDATNYYPARDGHFPELDRENRSSSELVAHALPETSVVKAFNTMNSDDLATQGNPALPIAERPAIFVAGDQPAAKQIVAQLIQAIGFAPVDTDTLREGGRRQQPGSPLYNHLMTGREAGEALRKAAAV